jgi:hypothetical protein
VSVGACRPHADESPALFVQLDVDAPFEQWSVYNYLVLLPVNEADAPDKLD